MFKKSLISAAMVAATVSAAPAFAESIPTTDNGHGTITFSGSVIDAPCSIPSESQNINVDLGEVGSARLKGENSTSDSVPVVIHLTGCSFETPSVESSPVKFSKVTVSFTNVNAPETTDGTLDKGVIKNMDPTPASHVAIQLLGPDYKPVNLSATGKGSEIQLETTSADNSLNFYARMISVAGSATPGGVGATITYKLKYV